MKHLPDAATLDALVIGGDEPDDHEAWEALVTLPGGAEAWSAAVSRRRRIDRLAAAIRGRPWLARAMLALSRAARKLRVVPELDVAIGFPDRRLGELASAVLGPSESSEDDEPTRLVWGQTVTVRLRIGEHVQIPIGGPSPVSVRYACNETEDVLPTGRWKLEPGDAPVLLVARVGLDPDGPAQADVGHATGIAGVLLLEEPSGETSE